MQRIAIRTTGCIWVVLGCFLLFKGISLSLSEGISFFFFASSIGFLKGYFVLQRTANRISSHILSSSLPLSFKTLYPVSYWILIGFMSFLGFAFNFFELSSKIRGFIDLSIGCALLMGSIFYFKRTILKPSLPEKKQLL